MRLDSDTGALWWCAAKIGALVPCLEGGGNQTSDLAKNPSQISCRGTKLASLVSGNEALGSGACSRWGVLELLVVY